MSETHKFSSLALSLRIITPLTLALTASACSDAQNPFKQISANMEQSQADAKRNTTIARRDALNELAAEQALRQKTVVTDIRKPKRLNDRFQPDADRMMQRDSVGTPANLQAPQIKMAALKQGPKTSPDTLIDAIREKKDLADNRVQELQDAKNVAKANKSAAKQSDVAMVQPEKDAVTKPDTVEVPKAVSNQPLAKFRAKLAALKSGQRTKPITILHIGDSHVASDSFSQGIRNAMQAEFGDAGRGMVIPAGAFKYGFADQIKMTRSGKWRSATALKNKRTRYGISGVQVTTASPGSKLKVKSRTGSFDYVEVTVATGPKQGRFKLTSGDKSETFNARSSKSGTKVFRLDGTGDTAVLTAAAGRTTVHNWETGKNRAGIRYSNFGLIGATLNITKRFNMDLVANDVRTMAPDLIVYGFGTNEGFNDNLNLKRYSAYAAKYLDALQNAAPDSDVVILGAADGLRRKKRGGKSCPGGWYIPPKMQPLRAAMKQMATERNDGYWDWSQAMGGPCSANRWAAQGLAAKDRVHLTSKGYRRSAAAFAAWLVADDELKVASR